MGYAGSQFHRGPNYLQDPLTPLTHDLVYWNTEQSCTDTCPAGSITDPITVTIPAHTYSSSVSQEDADTQAHDAACAEAAAQRAENPCQYPPKLFTTGYGGFGALGLGDFLDEYEFTEVTTPARTWATVMSGNDANSTMAVDDTGAMWGTGDSFYGNLGIGVLSGPDINVFTQAGTDTDWSSDEGKIGTGAQHTIAIKADGTLWACGRNNWGQLGLGAVGDQGSFVQIGTDTNWMMACAGQTSSCALKSDGTLWAWGHNFFGQLGLGDNSDRNTPTQVGVDTDWAFVSMGGNQMAAIKTDGSLWTTGENNSGQLGLNDTTNRNFLTAVGGTTWATVIYGREHVLALKTDGSLWACGWNSYGQLGNNTTTDSHLFIQIGSAVDWTKIAAGNFMSGGIRSGKLWMWGDNSLGECGLGFSTGQVNVPTQVGSDSTWQRIVCGKQTSAGIKT